VCGVGAGGQMAFEVNKEMMATLASFVYQQLMQEKFDYVDLFSKVAFKMFSIYMTKVIIEPTLTVIEFYDDFIEDWDNYKLWWEEDYVSEAELRDTINSVLTSRGTALRLATPEAKGRILAILSQEEASGRLESRQEDAIVQVFMWTQCQQEADKILKCITLTGKRDQSVEEGKAKLFRVLDPNEVTYFNNWYNSLDDKAYSEGTTVSMNPALTRFPVNLKGVTSNIGFA